MTTQDTLKTKDEILKAFNTLAQIRERLASQISTKAQAAEKAQERALVDQATTYTVESIIKGLADLQLGFGDELEKLADTLQGESDKLVEIQRAIHIEAARLNELRNIRVAAEAIAIQRQENAETLAKFEAEANEKSEDLQDSISNTRSRWEKEQAEHEEACESFNVELAKSRQQEEENFVYDLARKRKIEADKNSDKKRDLQRKLADQEAGKSKDWGKREQVLADNAVKIQELRDKVEAFPAELEQEVSKAKDAAIKSANSNAKVAAELAAKQSEGKIEVFELSIQSLESTITAQDAQLEKLQAQLQEAGLQSQELAVKAIENANK